MSKHPIIYIIIGIAILLIPTIIYLCFLVPKLSEEYNVLMASGGIIGGSGFYAASQIPEKLKYSSLFKLATNSFTILTIILIVEKFIIHLIGLGFTFIISYIIFILLKGVYKNARRKNDNRELAEEISRNINKTSK